jgi:hypothetical protein
MGRPPLRKKGAFTPAERQRRRRKRLAAERREAERAAKRGPVQAAKVYYWPDTLVAPEPSLPATSQDVANELVRQIHEVVLAGDTTLADVMDAIWRRLES